VRKIGVVGGGGQTGDGRGQVTGDRLQRTGERMRGWPIGEVNSAAREPAQADFVPYQPRFQSPGTRLAG
jgi:hypothetical protein